MKKEPQIQYISEARSVSKSYSARLGLRANSGHARFVQAVDRTSIQIRPGESVGLVGESGCGKSTLGRLLLRLESPTDGQVLFNNQDITRAKGRTLRRHRQKMQMIFQDPASSLNPRLTVEATIKEAIEAHRGHQDRRRQKAHIAALLNMVGLPTTALERQPHEFSGGEKQRISIARALAVEPQFLIADEPVTALDIASQEQILSLLETIKQELNVAILFITHDMTTVQRMCKRIAVMYLGRIVEAAPTNTVMTAPQHPYTRALIHSQLSVVDGKRPPINLLKGDPPSPLAPPTGCHFHPRCPYADIQCEKLVPSPRHIGDQHEVRCHFDFDGRQKRVPKQISKQLKIEE